MRKSLWTAAIVKRYGVPTAAVVAIPDAGCARLHLSTAVLTAT